MNLHLVRDLKAVNNGDCMTFSKTIDSRIKQLSTCTIMVIIGCIRLLLSVGRLRALGTSVVFQERVVLQPRTVGVHTDGSNSKRFIKSMNTQTTMDSRAPLKTHMKEWNGMRTI